MTVQTVRVTSEQVIAARALADLLGVDDTPPEITKIAEARPAQVSSTATTSARLSDAARAVADTEAMSEPSGLSPFGVVEVGVVGVHSSLGEFRVVSVAREDILLIGDGKNHLVSGQVVKRHDDHSESVDAGPDSTSDGWLVLRARSRDGAE